MLVDASHTISFRRLTIHSKQIHKTYMNRAVLSHIRCTDLSEKKTDIPKEQAVNHR